MSILSAPCFHDEAAAFAYLEAVVWPNGPVCPKCGNADAARIGTLGGKSTRIGVKKCYECRKPFTVKVGTVFESAHIPLHKCLQAVYLLTSSKKGFSAHQLHRVLGVTYKSAWFLAHRIREAMRAGGLAPMGGLGGAVEADETFIGREPGKEKKRAYHHKMKVLTLIDRETAQARSVVVNDLKPATIEPIIKENIAREARLMTDEAGHYLRIGKTFAQHGVVQHVNKEYVRGDVHTNTAEGYFSIFKRGMKGVYQHCGKQHLHRYLAEFDFRYNQRARLGVDDPERSKRTLMGISGKRLKYRDGIASDAARAENKA
jgi:transposase-like protein